MVFKRLLGSPGAGGPSVDTVLEPGPVRPGGTLAGQVRLVGGDTAFDVEQVALELVARVRDGEGGSAVAVPFERFAIGGGFRLGEGEARTVPFGVTLPWETPVTELEGRELGVRLGVRAELAVAGAREPEAGDDPGPGPDSALAPALDSEPGPGDDSEPGLDPLGVGPLPAQEAILGAFRRLGYGLRSAGLEHGRIGGTGQRLPFHQEIGLTPAPSYADRVEEIELTFLTHPGGMDVVLEADKRGGGNAGDGDDTGHDALSRFTVGHDDARDWAAEVDGWVRELVEHREAYGSDSAYGHGGPHSSGPGIG
ncbi:sporulation protein [Streptomyces prasinopilosus]|uniref:Sporulation-control protein n=1 Tax=Streptomyces prasinopilosus TaxID=67344 RepID=A0A1G6VSN4_9ACTN|nr:sporulation protein [Streptomyces prasinopilosus]SDD55836.1 sporulation-control protein [Streptomyces prasinopilosus]